MNMSTYYHNDQHLIHDTGYEYDNIQDKLDHMTEVELQSDYAQKLMDRAKQIREEWRK